MEGHSNRFFNGFLIGALIGGGVVFLVGTKKGRRLLKTFSEEGLEGLTTFIEEHNLEEELDEDEEDVVKPVSQPVTNGELSKHKANPTKRRFFKRFTKSA